MNSALNAVTKLAIPAAVGISLFQASLYDVKGGSRAVIFDRLAGVKDEVGLLGLGRGYPSSLPPQFLTKLQELWSCSGMFGNANTFASLV